MERHDRVVTQRRFTPGAWSLTAPTEHADRPAVSSSPDSPAAPNRSGDRSDDGSRRGVPSRTGATSLWWRYGFPGVLAACILAIPVLVWTGGRIVLDSREGRQIMAVTDPAAPGWEATVDPTPLMAVAVEGDRGALDHVAVLTLTGEGSGGVIVIPPTTLMPVPGAPTMPLDAVYQLRGAQEVRAGVEAILSVGIPEIRVVRPAEWADLTAPVSPLAITNTDPVTGPAGEVIFPRGAIDVPASRVWTYIGTRSPGENELSRMVRVGAFWRGWVQAIGRAPDLGAAVPGEVDSGLGRFLRSLAGRQVVVSTLPVVRFLMPDGSGEVFDAIREEVPAFVQQLVPFPAGPEGQRLRLRVLDGTGRLGHGLEAARSLTAGGGQIDKVGNAEAFDVETTTLTYYDDALRGRVEALRDALGVGELVKSDALNVAVDVTVVLGADYAAARTGDRAAASDGSVAASSGAGGG